MATGDKIETRGHLVGFKEEIAQAAARSAETFFTWFDAAENLEEAFVRGSWDFSVNIAGPLAGHLANPQRLTALEIGYGGGRILAAAARHFHHVWGVDIHDHQELVAGELRRRGLQNFSLAKSSGAEIPLPPDSVDVVYSFIVMQHVEKVSVFLAYLQESFRILKPGGLCLLYFGRYCRFSNNKRSVWRLRADLLWQFIALPRGFHEFPAKVNCTNLRITTGFARRRAAALGFDPRRTVITRKRIPDLGDRFDSQAAILLRKPNLPAP